MSRNTGSAWVAALLLLSSLAIGCAGAQATSTPPAPTARPAGTAAPGAAGEPAVLESLAQAQALVSFTILEPDGDTLPAGLRLQQVLWWPASAQGDEAVSARYQAAERELVIAESRLSAPLAAPREPHSVVQVRGQAAYLLARGNAYTLSWEDEERGIRIGVTVSAAGLAADELLRVAGALRPVVIGAGLSREEALSAAIKIALSARPGVGAAQGSLEHVQAELTNLAAAAERLGGGDIAGRRPQMAVWLVTLEGEWADEATRPAGAPTLEPFRRYAVILDATTGEEIVVVARK